MRADGGVHTRDQWPPPCHVTPCSGIYPGLPLNCRHAPPTPRPPHAPATRLPRPPGLLCLFAYMYARPFIRVGLGSAKRCGAGGRAGGAPQAGRVSMLLTLVPSPLAPLNHYA